MKRKRYTEPQIVFALQQAESGTPVGEICRKLGIPEGTFFRWKQRYGKLGGRRSRGCGSWRMRIVASSNW